MSKEKAMEGFISEPGHPRLTGGDKENILPNNMGKLYDFFLLLSMITANMKKMDVHMDKVQKGT